MSLSVDDVGQDVSAAFPELDSDPHHQPYLDDYAKIGSFLSGRKAIEPFLERLEERLQDRMFRNLGYDTPRGRLLQDARRKYYTRQANAQFGDWQQRLNAGNAGMTARKDDAFSKLLTDELSAIETGAGFQLLQDHLGHPRVVMIMPLGADTFRDQVRARRPFKDPTIGPDHGEYTHRVQWALIVLAGLVTDPALVYERIGEVPWSVSPNFGLWDALVDRQPTGAPGLPTPFPFYKRNPHDFRTPEALLTWLCQATQLQKYPLLAGFLKARKDKRQFVTDHDSAREPLLRNYLARKLFNVPFMGLEKERQDYVDDFLLGSQQDGVLRPRPDRPGYVRA